jgi:hypothetical protein
MKSSSTTQQLSRDGQLHLIEKDCAYACLAVGATFSVALAEIPTGVTKVCTETPAVLVTSASGRADESM